MRALLLRASLAAAAALLVACDGEPDPTDAGPTFDAGPDAATRPDGGPPPMCTPECALGETCCGEPSGPTCYDLRFDPLHCGGCNVNCIGSHRGDGCDAMQCTCGDSPLGCQGTPESWCCPARRPGGAAYCANLGQSVADCGECNRGCDPAQADHCDGGACICGDERRACAGTIESTCCADTSVDVGCADMTTDRFHCGACGVLCQGIERCENAACTRGAACAERCLIGQICCDGTCCTRAACLAGTCGAAPDGGMGDAGIGDAGLGDAGPDAG